MKNIIKYYKYNKSGADIMLKHISPSSFNLFAFILGPFIFLFYKMWKCFCIYFLFMMAIDLLSYFNVIEMFFVKTLTLFLHIVISSNFNGLKEIFYIEEGYNPVIGG